MSESVEAAVRDGRVSARAGSSDASVTGRVVRARRVADLTLAETVYEPSAVVPPHTHDSSRLCLVLEGGFAEQAAGTSKRCSAGSLLFHPRGKPHAQLFGDSASRCLTIELEQCLESKLSALDVAVPPTPVAAHGKAAWLAIGLYEEFCRLDGASDLAAEGLCLAMLAELTRDAVAPPRDERLPRWLKAVQSLLEARCHESVRLGELAAAVDVHPVHLSRVFHQRLGVTLTEYVRERRLEWAAARLLRTDLPSSRIAVEAGFRDHGHFTRAFKAASGMTPREFRAAIMQKHGAPASIVRPCSPASDAPPVVRSSSRRPADSVPLGLHCCGEVRRVRRVGQLVLAETEQPAAASAPTHAHSSSSFCLVLGGGFADDAGETRRYGAAGSVLFQPRGEPHSRQFGAATSRCFTVDLGPCLTARLEGRGLGGPGALIVTQGRAAWLATRLYEEFCRVDAQSTVAIEGLSLAVLAQLSRVAVAEVHDDRTPPWLPALLGLLDERYLARMRVSELAARVGVHPGHLSRVFRRQVGVSLTDYVRRRRIDWACDRLVATELPLSRIAMEAGFTDQAHFARVFKRATGLTPRGFRVARAGIGDRARG